MPTTRTSLTDQIRAARAIDPIGGLHVSVYATDGTHDGTLVCEGQLGFTCRPDDALEVRSLIFDADGRRMHAIPGRPSWDFIHAPDDP